MQSFKLSAALFCAALAAQYIPTTTAAAFAHPGPDPDPAAGYPTSDLADRLLQMLFNAAEQEREMVQEQREEETAENNAIDSILGIDLKDWWGKNHDPIITPRGYNVFALQDSAADREGMNYNKIMHSCMILP